MRMLRQTHRLLVLMLAAALLAAAGPAVAADQPPSRTIRVQGVGTVDAKPDQAVILAATVDQEASAGRALEANSAAMRRVFSKLSELGIAEPDTQTRGFSVTPLFERQERGTATPRIIGYRVTNQVAVTVHDLDRLGTLMDAVVAAGANRLDGVRFSIADPARAGDAARIKAMADARRRAELYAKAAGVGLGRVMEIVEQGVAMPRPVMLGGAEMRAAAVPVAPGEQKVSARVTVVYAIE